MKSIQMAIKPLTYKTQKIYLDEINYVTLYMLLHMCVQNLLLYFE